MAPTSLEKGLFLVNAPTNSKIFSSMKTKIVFCNPS
jgi:hypothetical protein